MDEQERIRAYNREERGFRYADFQRARAIRIIAVVFLIIVLLGFFLTGLVKDFRNAQADLPESKELICVPFDPSKHEMI